ETYVLSLKREKKGIPHSVLILLLIVSSTLTILSQSRTSTITMISVILTGLVIIFIRVSHLYNKRFFLKLVFVFILLIITIYSIIKITSFDNIIFDVFISKFIQYEDNIFNSRDIIWNQIIQDAKWFGYGSDYFSRYNLGPHNTFMRILAEEGWVPLVFFGLFIGNIYIKSWK